MRYSFDSLNTTDKECWQINKLLCSFILTSLCLQWPSCFKWRLLQTFDLRKYTLSKYSGDSLIVICFISKMKFTLHFEIRGRALLAKCLWTSKYSRMISVFAEELKKRKVLRFPQQHEKLCSLFIIHRFPYLGRARLVRGNVVSFYPRRCSLQS